MLHGILEVLHHALLPDNFLNARLCLNIKGVCIQLLNLPLPLQALAAFPFIIVVEELGKQMRVIDHAGKLWLLPHSFLSQPWIAQDLQPDHFWVRLGRWPVSRSCTSVAASCSCHCCRCCCPCPPCRGTASLL